MQHYPMTNIGKVYAKLGDYQQAIDYQTDALSGAEYQGSMTTGKLMIYWSWEYEYNLAINSGPRHS